MIKLLKIFGALVICVIVFLVVQKVFFNHPSSDKEVKDFVKGLNKTCPTMIDKETRLDKVITFPDNNLQFNYTLVNQVKDSLPIPRLKSYMEPVIIEKIKNSGTLRKLIGKKLTWIYSYNDKNGDFIFKVTYTPDQIKN
jgi:hypothetical protein